MDGVVLVLSAFVEAHGSSLVHMSACIVLVQSSCTKPACESMTVHDDSGLDMVQCLPYWTSLAKCKKGDRAATCTQKLKRDSRASTFDTNRAQLSELRTQSTCSWLSGSSLSGSISGVGHRSSPWPFVFRHACSGIAPFASVENRWDCEGRHLQILR